MQCLTILIYSQGFVPSSSGFFLRFIFIHDIYSKEKFGIIKLFSYISNNQKWQNMKQCKKCNKVKDYTQFSKNSRKKDGLQDRCKSCNKIDNHKFRTEINPQHHSIWQSQNRERACYHVSKWRKGDKAGIVYALINPEKQVYVGQTKTYLSVRMIEHRVKYRRYLENKLTNIHPLLFESFKKYGIENHKVKVLFLDENISKKELKQIEKEYIKKYMQKGNSLNKIL